LMNVRRCGLLCSVCHFLFFVYVAVLYYDESCYCSQPRFQLLIDNMSVLDVRVVDVYGETALMKECRRGDLMAVKSLLELGSVVNHKDREGRTCIMWAAREGHYNVVKLLLERSADVNMENGEGRTALHFAARNGHSDVCRVLLDGGANVNKKTTKGDTAMMMAAEMGRVQTVKLLMERGATTHDVNNNGVSALMFACQSMKSDERCREITKILSKSLENVFSSKVCEIFASIYSIFCFRGTMVPL
jgi:ankyrin repeat protein